MVRHPLFPLLALLLERCEAATGGCEAPGCEAFAADLRAFVQHQQRDRKPFLVDDPEIDGLVWIYIAFLLSIGIVFNDDFYFSDDQINTSTPNTFVRTGKSTRIMSRLL